MYCSKFFEDNLIRFNYPKKNVLVAFKEITSSIIKCNSILDRSNFYPHPLLIHAPKIPKIKNISFEQCMYDRAIELSNITGPKKILWSGGIDSTALLISLIKYDSEFNYEIICRPSSLQEYPMFYEKYVSKMHHTIETNNVKDFFNKIFDNSIVITGYLGDELFFNFLMVKNKDIPLEQSWKSLIPLLKNEQDLCVDILETHVLNSPISIKTVGDLYWWINFAFDWTTEIYRPGLVLDNAKNIANHIPFFASDNFQSWALYNYHDIKIPTWNEMHKHKRHLKQYIYEFTKDKEYFDNKQKEDSYTLGFNRERMKFKRHCLYDDYSSPNTLVDFLKEHSYLGTPYE